MLTASLPTINTYTFNEHKHRYAIWAAARAQRAFKKNEEICEALENTSLRQFSEQLISVTQTEFDHQHREWCHAITKHFGEDKCKYGRAAKLVAIYLKTAVVLPSQGASQLCQVIHPPIDSILLHHIAQKTSLKDVAKLQWTKLDEEPYWALIDTLRKQFGECNWLLEYYWNIAEEELEQKEELLQAL